MNTDMNTSYQSVSKNNASIYEWKNRTGSTGKSKTSETVQPRNEAVSKDEVVISKSVRDATEIQSRAKEDQAADSQAENKAQMQMRSGKMSSSDKTFIQLAGQYRDLTKDPSTWPSMKELELLTNRTVRQETEKNIESLLRENGIHIPEGQSVRLTVDSCDYHISVEGLADKELAESIEKALNQGQNGFDLFTHIQKCAPSKFGYEDPAQFHTESSAKSTIYHLVKELAGYDIRGLENQDGKFYTPEGNDLWLELKEKAEAYSPFRLEKYHENYEKLAKNGWESSSDYILSLDYAEGHLLDIDTEYGYGFGQTEWQEELLAKFIPADEDKAPETGQMESEVQNADSNDGESSAKIIDPNLAFPKFNPALKYAKYLKVLDEYYGKQNEENLRFANPSRHIQDKYFNKRSPYYIEGLSQREREIGADQELGMLCGRQPSLNHYDPVIQRVFGGCNSFQADEEYKQELCGQISDCINQTFSQNGIHIPDGTTLYLTVDPYDYQIHAGGVEKGLAASIEAILNQGENGYSLYNYISYCNPGNMGQTEPEQYRQGDKAKAAVYHMVKQLTNYDLRTLENRNGKFYTSDGQDLWDVLSERYRKMTEQGEAGSFRLENYYDHYRRIAKEGWNRGNDANLTVGYKNGTLYDVEQYRKI